VRVIGQVIQQSVGLWLSGELDLILRRTEQGLPMFNQPVAYSFLVHSFPANNV
jgi:hypothetical protein